MKLAAMISSEPKIAGVTSRAASERRRPRSSSERFSAPSRCLCAASTITISASTVAPMAMAMPPSDMIVAGTPSSRIGMKAASTARGRERIGSSALRRCSRKSAMTAATTIISSTRVCRSVSMARSMSAARSYAVTTSTPGGSASRNPARRVRTRSMTSRALAPWVITTTPETTSPSPSSSATPRRGEGARATRPTSRTRTARASAPGRTSADSRSSARVTKPRLRTKCSRCDTCRVRPPTSPLAARTAAATSARVTPRSRRRTGSTVT